MEKNIASDKSLDGIGSGKDLRTWQTILDDLTNKAGKTGLLKEIQNEIGFEKKLRRAIESVAVR